MSRHYSKVALTIPSAREVFLSPVSVLNIARIDMAIKNFPIEKLRSKLAEAHILLTDLNKFRVFVFCTSKALSNYGIAPRWQNLQNACKTEKQQSALVEDEPIIDAYWLALTFPKHKTINQRWQSIFTDGFGMELAVSIGERQITTAKKIRHDFELSRFQQIGCLNFLRKAKYPVEGKLSAMSLLQSAQKSSQVRHERELRRSDTVYQVTPKVATYRALIWECYMLAEKSPTNAARIYKWMTGVETNRANVNRTIKRINETVARRRVGAYVGGVVPSGALKSPYVFMF
ncbi:hypothetical protein ABXJ76_06780 [Methylobacter sp. G7]|uniref:hypothetical protein n=1 Tax=Methylobacter sp. G7 TaxID=3230117 RepID=UPI003D800E2D